MTTIKIPVPDSADLNGDGIVTLDELIRSTTHTIILVAAVLFALAGGVYLVILIPWLPVKVAIGILALSVLIGSALGLYRQSRYERAEKLAAEERERRRKREDYEFDLLRGAATREDTTRWDNAVQNQYARLWLRLSFERGKPVTRDEWRDLGQPIDAWNRINGLMKSRKIRRGNSLDYETMADAWGAWCDAELESRAWVKSGTEYIKD